MTDPVSIEDLAEHLGLRVKLLVAVDDIVSEHPLYCIPLSFLNLSLELLPQQLL